MMKQLERKHITILIESLFVNEIYKAMILYFNNMKIDSSIAINNNLEYIKYLIAQYYDFTKHKNNFTRNRLCEIYSYLAKQTFDIPYLQKEINEEDFIKIFDYINTNFNHKNKTENKEYEESEMNEDYEIEDNDFIKLTDIIIKIKVNQKTISR